MSNDEDVIQIDSNGEIIRSNVVGSSTDRAAGKTLAIHDSKGEY
ncbi:MAG: hypothetical protein ACTSR9_18250 [Candidatus Thorarchaeota archaeon]